MMRLSSAVSLYILFKMNNLLAGYLYTGTYTYSTVQSMSSLNQ